ncbi:hypothetical protein [Ancylobacter amanitiformis]|uniref:Uncharacterized protein n=1 Tax=Ancylobacter amanitiformis TaxID=217069 RepID=A0ABU0LPW0_9HYPH|nr:hypothetical protein [Ancylobacter amanitiformis]MDQ0510739.1 hypothetical protein [Ancylobacter amanitiformis]
MRMLHTAGWVLLTLLLILAGWVMLQACGISLFGHRLAWCSVADTAPGGSIARLYQQGLDLERRVADAPACQASPIPEGATGSSEPAPVTETPAQPSGGGQN